MRWYLPILTWPYYRTYLHSTLLPAKRITAAAESGDVFELRNAIENWRTLRLEELLYVKTAVRSPQVSISIPLRLGYPKFEIPQTSFRQNE